MRTRIPKNGKRRMNNADAVARNNGTASFMPPPFQLKGAEQEEPAKWLVFYGGSKNDDDVFKRAAENTNDDYGSEKVKEEDFHKKKLPQPSLIK